MGSKEEKEERGKGKEIRERENYWEKERGNQKKGGGEGVWRVEGETILKEKIRAWLVVMIFHRRVFHIIVNRLIASNSDFLY